MPDSSPSLFQQAYGRPPSHVASSPGRIEFIGNHTDYNGGLVLGAAIDRRVDVALALRSDRLVRMTSAGNNRVFQTDLDPIEPQQGDVRWVNYPLGVLWALRDEGLPADRGFDLAVTSSLPVGAGLSSSAALELSTALALQAAFGVESDRKTLALSCRRAENEFVGVPCGILDQGVSAFGKADHLVRIDCKTLEFGLEPLPPGTAFWIFNSHRKHSLIGSLYAARHQECMEAIRILGPHYADASFLADLTPDQVDRYKDELTEPLYKRAMHITAENARVKEMHRVLEAGDLEAAGDLLYASHASSQRFFENSTPELDFLVASLQGVPHVYGARLTGGGFGGAVMAFTDEPFGPEDADAVARRYNDAFGHTPSVITCRTADGGRVARYVP